MSNLPNTSLGEIQKETLHAYLQDLLSTDFEVPVAVAADAAAAAVAADECLTVEAQQLDWQTEHWDAGGADGVQPPGSFLQWSTGFGGGLTGQPA